MSEQEENKKWYLSKGVWGGLVAALAGLAGLFGYAVSPDDQVALADAIPSAISAVGGLIAVLGRIKANKKIG